MSDSSTTPVSSALSARITVAVDVPLSDVELFGDRLFTAGASAVAERVGDDGSVTLIADLDVDAVERLSRDLETDLSDVSEARPAGTDDAQSVGAQTAGLTLRTLEPEAAWNDGWRDFAKARRCGRIVIRPVWLPADSPVEVDAVRSDRGASETIELLMEPGVAFGSGTHVTTRLCVEAVDRLVTPGVTVLDVGCGTGVLGVAAAMLGAESVVAVDIDPEAVRVTRDLAERNGVADRVAASMDRLEDVAGRFDLVLANVLIPVFEELGAHMVERVRPGGRLVASGLLAEHQERARAALDGLELESAEHRDGWLLLEFTKPESV